MLVRHAAFCGLLLTAPLVGLAQTTKPAPPRFYVGLSAYTSAYQRASRQFGKNQLLPLQATVGYQLTPRWAVQTGLAYNVGKGVFSGTSYDFDGSVRGDYRAAFRTSTLSLSALGRYTLTRTPIHRFQVDLLGGVTMEHRTSRSSGFSPDNTQPGGISTYNTSWRGTSYLLTFGPSLRYRVSPKVDLVGEGTMNVNMETLRDLTTSGALGVRYRFGR
ncbi:outer membrane beta-barrel protein [Hymenobacter fodinae]|uniref:Outer membrane protein beta-barrel domain-containing protein n=1 Tax=Hymenobacter fodinae TaxID=2510796 RepID=A0A4Z0P874_9BACT|nr:outer membrane beta-barrel protein [Hymenobacter fodinae]TGE08200.1 hypothetical protein EU556_10755 [Hymenobacter fodinae]